jgi:arylsulfatase A-like enzyme/cytochrome c-type biogenesis protein CcmH/NrfG
MKAKGKRLLPLIVIVLRILFSAGACSPKSDRKVIQREDLNVLLITIDTLRADRVGYSGYAVKTPNLDLLARGGAQFMNAVCQVPLTLPSHASILTGTNPPFHQVKNNGTYALRQSDTTLAEILRERGYETAAFIGAFPLDSQFGLDQGFGLYDDNFKNPDYLAGYEPQRTAEQVFDAAAAWLGRNAGKKFFAWVHYYDPHLPYTPPPPFDKAYASPYDGEVAYTDVYVGKLRKLLEGQGVAKETLIVVAGDHGEGLGDHGEDTHGIFLYDSTLKIPLVFCSPGVIPAGIEVRDQVGTVDILPTILDLLKIPVPGDCQGTSLVPSMEGKKADRDSYAETYLPLLACGWSELKSIRTNRWKFILAPKPELYDLTTDPFEKKNIIDGESETAGQLRTRLEGLEKSLSSPEAESSRSALTQEDQEKLSSLGYVGRSPEQRIPKHSDIDPKDKISIFEAVVKAELALARGAPEEAAEILKRIVAGDPENPWLLHFLGKAYQKMDDSDEAIKAFTKAVRINPNDVYSHYLLARSFFKKGMTTEAKNEAVLVLSYFADHLGSLLLLAEIHVDSGEYDTAIMYLERAVRGDPDNLTTRLLFAHTLALAKHYERALAEYEFLQNKMPDDPGIFHNLGMLSMLTDQAEKGIRYFLRELELREDPETRFLLGIAYGKLERYPEAISCLERYLASLPAAATDKRQKAEAALRMFRSKLP